MKVLKLATIIDESGNLRLDIPTELASGAVDVVIVLNPSIPDTPQTKSYDFSDLAGRLSCAIAPCIENFEESDRIF
ncbi:hypothetical protein [Brunnivagina elsteri]|uniref:Uncharacterized protein n=1 Tax=Brunnivagina elsteri CCALA 953 TaxID=987040 RepID=A0A2A2T9U2_9CYAN|nr:hypothetical protein [Calothrix elsteri]PAX45773.1 hypothetical protein CK510_29940 [Calothrix elsteri CCALA 953]